MYTNCCSHRVVSVKQGVVISPLLFSLHVDELFLLLKGSGLGCHVGSTYVGAFGYADDISLIALVQP